MLMTVTDEMARTKSKARTEAKPEPIKHKPTAAQIRGSEEWKGWLERFAEFERDTVAGLIDRALQEHAERRGFQEKPPKR